ncbi:MAG: hypothetical protein EAZ30_17330 [Betaproteobacteria bacterium]|nr:MAG: hypothetical protein EAZ30_17330 [Betaproteobacteria bacterium]
MTTPNAPSKPLFSSLRKGLKPPRMFDWLIAAVLLAVLVWCIAPQQLPVSLYKLSLVALAAVAGYWIDRSLFPYARPDFFLQLGEFEDAPEPLCEEPSDDADTSTLELHAAPDEALLRLMGVAMLRRAIIVAATMLAVGLGA